jgi:hypothetical protein
MRIVTGTLSRQGKFETMDGVIPSESKALGKEGVPYCHIYVGRPNADRCFTPITLGIELSENLKKRFEPCPKDGDGSFGFCKHCGLHVTEKHVMGKVLDFTMPNGIDIFKNVAHHAQIGFPEPITHGSFILDKRKRLLLLKDRSTQEDRRIALLLYVEPGIGGSSSIEPVITVKSPMLTAIHDKAVGQRWIGASRGLGVGVERLMILSPGDFVYVSQDGRLEPKSEERKVAAYKITVHRKGTLTCAKVDAAPSVGPASPGAVTPEDSEASMKAALMVSEPKDLPVQHACEYPAKECTVCLNNQGATAEAPKA